MMCDDEEKPKHTFSTGVCDQGLRTCEWLATKMGDGGCCGSDRNFVEHETK